jgi:hypothetical protein
MTWGIMEGGGDNVDSIGRYITNNTEGWSVIKVGHTSK